MDPGETEANVELDQQKSGGAGSKNRGQKQQLIQMDKRFKSSQVKQKIFKDIKGVVSKIKIEFVL